MEPAHKLPGRLLDGRPEAVPLELLVIAEEPGQYLVLDLVTVRRYPAGDEVHDARIGVQADQVVHVGHREPAEHEPPRFEEDLHRWILPTRQRYPLATRPPEKPLAEPPRDARLLTGSKLPATLGEPWLLRICCHPVTVCDQDGSLPPGPRRPGE